MYDFDKEIVRRGTASLKWDACEGDLPLWVADMDFTTAPCVIEAIKRRAEHGIYGYTVVPDKWYEAYISWWGLRHGLHLKKDELIFCTGVVPAISSIVKRLTNVGDNVVVMTPAYNVFFSSIENFGRHTLECRLAYDGAYSLDFLELERALSHPLTTLLILCNPHNPIGRIWTKDELITIGRLCRKHGVTVLSDEIHCDLVSPGKHYVPYASIEENKANSVTCISASKAFNLAGLQGAAVAVFDPILRNKASRGLNSDEVAEPNCFVVEATVAALNEGGPWLDELNAYIAYSRAMTEDFLKDNPYLRPTAADATYLAWIDCSALTDDTDAFCLHLNKTTGLYLSPGSSFRGNGRQFVRLNLACPRSRLWDALNRLQAGAKSFADKKGL